ncbi:hypothetical protein M407DRAFT_11432 [Tulasnella calospora MUT 4182]|uniref:Uncharacterized protein n=1 Tax=Tulasnella calospora MUT 4182 TaxID=1051891 RepID=A0A0C3Q6F9_9AGAM|nr:hypothetical protein M407DRAFT_11432 [Tulasnella calospora MUT 4182]
MAFNTTASKDPHDPSAVLGFGLTQSSLGIQGTLVPTSPNFSTGRGHGNRVLGTNSSTTPSVLLTFSVTSGPVGPCVICGRNPAVAAIHFTCGHVSCATHLAYFGQAAPAPVQVETEGHEDVGLELNRPTCSAMPMQSLQGEVTQIARGGHRNEIVPTPAKARTPGAPPEATPTHPPAMPSLLGTSDKQKQRADSGIVTNASPSGPNYDRERNSKGRDPSSSTSNAFAGIHTSSSRYPLSKSSGSSSESYGSWTTDEAAEAHAITAGFEALEIQRKAEALSQMDIVPDEDWD